MGYLSARPRPKRAKTTAGDLRKIRSYPGRGYVAHRTGVIQDAAHGPPRTLLLGTSVNKQVLARRAHEACTMGRSSSTFGGDAAMNDFGTPCRYCPASADGSSLGSSYSQRFAGWPWLVAWLSRDGLAYRQQRDPSPSPWLGRVRRIAGCCTDKRWVSQSPAARGEVRCDAYSATTAFRSWYSHSFSPS